MKILRKNMSSIEKLEFTADMFINYSKKQLLFIEKSLKKVIINYPISTIDCITYLRKHYSGNLIESMSEITDEEMINIRFNCIYQSKVLKEILEKNGIIGYYVSYKTHNFTTFESDKLIKEAHTAIFIPTIINNKKCFIILEPGLKLDKPIYYYGCKTTIINENLKIKIGDSNNEKYPLYLLLDGKNKYSYNPKPHKVYQEFNPNYYTINPIKILIPCVYKYLYAYRATNFSLNKEKRMSLTIYPIEKKITIYVDKTRETKSYSYDEINKPLLLKILPKLCKNLNLNLNETVDNILFMKEMNKEFILMMDNKTVLKYLRKW